MPDTHRAPGTTSTSEQALARAFSLSPTALTITSLATGRLIEVNESFLALTGHVREDALGNTPIELGLWVDPVDRDRGLHEIRARRPIRDREVRFRHKDGRLLDCLVSADLVVLDGQPCVLSVISDVTDRKRAEAELERSRRLFQQILEATPDIVYIFDLTERKIVYANRGAEEQLGYPQGAFERLRPETLRALFHPDEADRILAGIASRATLAEGEVAEIEFRIRHADGEWRWFRRRDAAFLRGPDGSVTQFLGVARDITDEKRRGETLRQSEERLRLGTELAGFGTFDIDLLTDTARLTPRLLEIYGLAGAEHSRAELRSLIHPEDRDRATADLDAAVGPDGGDFEIEYRIVRPSGATRWVIVKGRTLFAEQEGTRRAIRILGAVVDITDQKQAEESVRNSEALFRSLADTAPTIIWTAAPDGTTTFHNRQWLRYTGLAEAENGRGWAVTVHPDDYARHVDHWHRALATGTDLEIELRFRRHDGVYRWFLTRATPVRDPDGKISAWFGSSTDIDDRKQSEEYRERLLREMERLDRRKDEFLATLSHELRNPLAPIRNAVELLRQDRTDDATAKWAQEVIDRQVEQLSHLIDDLLDISRITSGKVRLDTRPAELAPIVSSALEASRPLIEERTHHLTVSYPTEPIWIDGDPVRLAQVITNLLNNAAKYTERGGRLWLSAARAGPAVVISVRDSGVGIPPELLPSVFELFTQADRSLERAQGGLGVGLNLVKSLVELHGGTVQAYSAGTNQGSEFVVTLPTIAAPPRVRRSGPVMEIGGRGAGRILVVDDNKDLAESTALLLERTGHTVAVAFDGPTALEQARQFHPTAILLDVGLPGMDGYEVVRALRKETDARGPIVIAVTGYGMAEDRARSKEAGFDHHLVKPIDFRSLERILRADPV